VIGCEGAEKSISKAREEERRVGEGDGSEKRIQRVRLIFSP
jgi:hypothetical protein